MENPASPQKSPYKVKVKKGKIYSWCTCGLSKNQPFCDNSHRKEGKLNFSEWYITKGDSDIDRVKL